MRHAEKPTNTASPDVGISFKFQSHLNENLVLKLDVSWFQAFHARDFEESLVYYTRSISLTPFAATYNNRALAC